MCANVQALLDGHGKDAILAMHTVMPCCSGSEYNGTTGRENTNNPQNNNARVKWVNQLLIIKTTVRLQKQVTAYVFRSRTISQKVITTIPSFLVDLAHVPPQNIVCRAERILFSEFCFFWVSLSVASIDQAVGSSCL